MGDKSHRFYQLISPELMEVDGVLLRGDIIVLSKALIKRVLEIKDILALLQWSNYFVQSCGGGNLLKMWSIMSDIVLDVN